MTYQSAPPQAVEFEQIILGEILLSDQDGFNSVFDYLAQDRVEPLTVDHFFDPENKSLFSKFFELYSSGKPVNLYTTSELCDRRKLAECVSASDGYRMSVGVRTLQEMVDTVIDKAKRRNLIAHYQQQSRNVYDQTITADRALSEYQAAVSSLEVGIDDTGLVTIGESLVGTLDLIERRMSGIEEAYLKTDLCDFDHQFGGLPDGMTVFMGRPAMGKTAAALTVALNAASRGESVLIFSLEMNAHQLNTRFISMVSGIDSYRIKRGKLTPSESAKIVDAITYLSGLQIFIMDRPASVEHLSKQVISWSRKHDKKPSLVIVDYLQLLETKKNLMEGNQKTAYISKKLQSLSKFLKLRPTGKSESFPLLAVCQLSRSVEARTNKRPTMPDLRESGQIEQDAEMIVGFYRDEYYNKDTCDIGIAEAIVVKNREGSDGTVKLLFQAETTRFFNLATEYAI